MKSILVCTVLLLVNSSLFAATFECQSFLNLSVTASRIMETEINEKRLAVQSEDVTAYLTAKTTKDYVLEVYIPESEMRIYSEASVIETDSTLTASAWTRNYIIDLTCRKLK